MMKYGKWALAAAMIALLLPAKVRSQTSTIDPASTAASAGKQVAGGLTTAGSIKNTLTKMATDANKAAQAALGITGGDWTSLAKFAKGIPGETGFDVSATNFKKYQSKEAVKKMFTEYFLRYPTNPDYSTAGKLEYENAFERFYEGTVLEVYNSSTELKKYLDITVADKVAAVEKALTEGGSGLPDPSADNESKFNNAKAYEAYDQLLSVLQKALALQAQLLAAERVKSGEVRPVYIPKSSDKKAALQPSGAFKIAGMMPLAFAKTAEEADDQEEKTPAVSPDEINAEIGGTITMVTLPASEKVHPFVSAADKIDALAALEEVNQEIVAATRSHNMVNSLKDYRENALAYQRMKKMHQRVLELLKISDTCAKNFLGRHFEQPEALWSGGAIGDNVAAHELRRGLSAWAIDAYDVAKAASLSPVSYDDAGAISLSSDEDDEQDAEEKSLSLEERQAQAEKTINSQSTGLSNPGDEDQIAAENRAINLISWQIGAEAVKSLAATPQTWGAVGGFPLWTDTKLFYKQYLDGKYANIRQLLKDQIDLEQVKYQVADSLKMPLLVASEKEITQRREDLQKIEDNLEAEETRLAAQRKSAVDAIISRRDATIKNLEAQKKALNLQLNEIGNKVKQYKQALEDYQNQLQEDATQSLIDEVTKDPLAGYTGAALESRYFYRNREEMAFAAVTVQEEQTDEERTEAETVAPEASVVIEESGYEATVGNNKEINLDASYQKALSRLQSGETEETLRQEIKSAEAELQKLSARVEEINEQIRQAKFAAQNEISEQSRQSLAAVEAAEAQAEQARDALEKSYAAKLTQAAAGILAPQLTLIRQNINAAAKASVKDLENLLDARINQAQKELEALGDELYDPRQHDKVVKIHQRLIDDLKIMMLTVKNPLKSGNLMSVPLFAAVLSADTSPETEEYFIGSRGKTRDLKAPRPAPDFNLPPLREIVHFDETDKENTLPTITSGANRVDNPAVATDAFLNYGGEIPPIWQLMLQDKVFVEKDFNLKAALNTGCVSEAFYRGGIFPCRIKDSERVVTVNGNGSYVFDNSAAVAECPYLTVRGGSLVYDTKTEGSAVVTTRDPAQASDAACEYSELGIFFEADENNVLHMRPNANAVFVFLKEQEDKFGQNQDLTSDSEKIRKGLYDHAPLSRNQIGDFLTFVEMEDKYRKSVEELQQSYEENKQDLRDLLSEFGLAPTEDFDLAKEADYQLVRDKLDRLKNRSIRNARTALGTIEAEDDVINERTGLYEKQLKALELDKNEMVPVSGSEVDLAALSEEIKTAEADQNVADAYRKTADEMFEKNLNNLSYPYCAIY